MRISCAHFFAVVLFVAGCGGGGSSVGTSSGGSAGGSGGGSGGGDGTRVSGRVLVEYSAMGLGGIEVRFFTGAQQVGTTTTASDGTFVANVPVGATRFHLVGSSFPTGYWRSYRYLGKFYAPLIDTCSAPLPTLTQGQTTPLTDNPRIPDQSAPPPPPPNGCVP